MIKFGTAMYETVSVASRPSFEEYVIEIHQIADAMGDDLGAIDDEIWRDNFTEGKTPAEAWNRFYSRDI